MIKEHLVELITDRGKSKFFEKTRSCAALPKKYLLD
jgi:hypothetical protein